MKKIIVSLILVAVLGLLGYFVHAWYANRLYRNPHLTSGNGRIEATEINISARLAGKVEKIAVLEGEKVEGGQVLVVMQTNVLVANLAQAEAKKAQAIASEKSANAQISAEQAKLESLKADREQRQAQVLNAASNYKRYKELLTRDATSQQHFETAETLYLTRKAEVAAADANIKESQAKILVKQAEAAAARANILAAEAEIARIKADIDDSILRAPLAGRIQYRVAEPGEVLAEGGRALNMVDLTDVYMTFFLPETIVGRVKVGADVRIVLDAVPFYPMPAKVSYVASVSQFTPKTVETKVERQKLMFRVKAHIDRNFLEDYIDMVKTGLPGEAWVKLDDSAPWPKELEVSEEVKAHAEKIRQELAARKNVTPRTVIQSETRKRVDARMLADPKLKEALKDATKEKAEEIAVAGAKQFNENRKETVEKTTAIVKKLEKAKEKDVSRIVEQAKKEDEAARKAPAQPAPVKAAPAQAAPVKAAPVKTENK